MNGNGVFAERIKAEREKMGLSTTDLAKKLEVQKTRISMWETNGTVPRQEMLFKLCELFNVSADYLLGNDRTDGKNPKNETICSIQRGWINPTGPSFGARRVNRGGGWNDFGKNLRSAYRAGAEQNTPLYNVGLRLVCNADDSVKGTVTTTEIKSSANTTVKKALIIYYSWSGNTRGVAKEIARQTSFDSIELELVKPYSTDYNTVLNEAQRDQHKQVRPALKTKIDPKKWAEYDTIIIGYPNWWASIPMPIATLLENYDFSGNKILPFCSHGGGRFGQSLTAIAKLAPKAKMEEGLSIHYSGGSSLSKDVEKWLKKTGVK